MSNVLLGIVTFHLFSLFKQLLIRRFSTFINPCVKKFYINMNQPNKEAKSFRDAPLEHAELYKKLF